MRISDWSSDVCSSDLVVAVRLVELEHRELGVVAGGEALVPEHPPDLEHPLEAADREVLQVELGRDPQEEVEVERAVGGGERAGERALGAWVQRRRLELEDNAMFGQGQCETQAVAVSA